MSTLLVGNNSQQLLAAQGSAASAVSFALQVPAACREASTACSREAGGKPGIPWDCAWSPPVALAGAAVVGAALLSASILYKNTTNAVCVCGLVLQLEQQIQQLSEQRQHVTVQLEQLEGCEGGKDDVGVADLKQQLQVSMLVHTHGSQRGDLQEPLLQCCRCMAIVWPAATSCLSLHCSQAALGGFSRLFLLWRAVVPECCCFACCAAGGADADIQ